MMSNSTSRSHRTAGKRRLRRRNPPHSTTSPHHTTPAETSTSRSHTRSTPFHAPAVLSPPPNLTSLQMAQYTAERVAHSTGMAVQKLALHRLGPHYTPERTLSEPDLTQVTPLDHVHRTPSQQPSSYHFTSKHLDSQGYSSGDEASYILTHSPSRPGPTSTTRHPTSSLKHSAPFRSTDTPQQYCSEPELSSGRDETTSPSLNTTVPAVPLLIHTPANISYPKGYSSAEKAAYVARLVAESTGTAVQKLSETISERTQLSLSLSSGEHPSPHAPSLSPLTDN